MARAENSATESVYATPVILDDRDERCSDADYVARARHHRELLNCVVIAVTGSCGKTTTKDLTAAVLGSRSRVTKSEDTKNCGLDLAASVLATDPTDEFLIQELGAWGPGTLDAGIEFIRAQIAVVTNLRHDHFSTLHGPRGAQAEKGKLVRSLPDSGIAVLNWDDPLVRELSTWTNARTLSFGLHPEAALRATDVRAAWPEPLSFTVTHCGVSVRVRTRLLGRHLLGSALAAMAVGVALDVPLEETAAALMGEDPTFRRMSPTVMPDGVTFIRDDWKAPADSIPEILTFLREATAARKILILGRVSDFAGRTRPTYERIAQQALAATDAVVFVGQRAAELWDARQGWISPSLDGDGQMFVFGSVQQADLFLKDFLHQGDLVLLKGSGPADHLERVLLHREQNVGCWRGRCERLHPCDVCELLDVPHAVEDR